jgi:hypothetical protein
VEGVGDREHFIVSTSLMERPKRSSAARSCHSAPSAARRRGDFQGGRPERVFRRDFADFTFPVL